MQDLKMLPPSFAIEGWYIASKDRFYARGLPPCWRSEGLPVGQIELWGGDIVPRRLINRYFRMLRYRLEKEECNER